MKKTFSDILKCPDFKFDSKTCSACWNEFVEIFKLNESVIKKVAGDKHMGFCALVSVIIGALSGPVINVFMLSHLNVMLSGFYFSSLFFLVFFQVFIVILGMAITTLIAVKLFNGSGDFSGIFRVLGLAYGVFAVNLVFLIFPFLLGLSNFILNIWFFIVSFVVVRVVFGLSNLNTFLTILVPLVSLSFLTLFLRFFNVFSGVGMHHIMMMSWT